MSFRNSIDSVLRVAQMEIKSGLELRTQIDSSIPDLVKGDPLRFRQVLWNMVINAIKFTEAGSIDIMIWLMKDEEMSIEVMTEIINTDIGVPSSIADSSFTPFTRLDNSLIKQYERTDLNLSICASLVKCMEGRLGFRPNSAGIGSVFWFTVTMSRAQNIPINPSIDDLSCSIRNVSADKRILLVEDNVVNQRVMSKMLINLGLTEMDIANNGREDVEYARQTDYDLILMDINMPILDGVDATKEIRDFGIKVPVIAVMANALKSDSATFLAAGMSDYIPKPVDKCLLVTLLAKWLVERDPSVDVGELCSA